MNGIGGRGLVGVAMAVAAAALGGCGSAATTAGPSASALPGAVTPGGGAGPLRFAGSPCQVLTLEDVAAAVGSKVTYDKSMLVGGSITLSEMYCAFANVAPAALIISVAWERQGAAAADAFYEATRNDKVPAAGSVSGLGLKAVCGTSSQGGATLVIRTADRAWSLDYDFRSLQSPPSEQTACDTLTGLARKAIDRLQGSGPLISPTPGTSG